MFYPIFAELIYALIVYGISGMNLGPIDTKEKKGTGKEIT